jgi:hypothetical protein
VSNQDYPPFGKSEGSTNLAIKIGLAIFLAILAASAIRWLYANWVMHQAVESFNKSIVQIQVQSQAQLAAIQLREQQKLEHAARLKALEIAQRKQEQEERERQIRQQQEMLAAKEVAWERFYKPRLECTNPRSNDELVECGNEYHRAKVRFEQIWRLRRSGGLSPSTLTRMQQHFRSVSELARIHATDAFRTA